MGTTQPGSSCKWADDIWSTWSSLWTGHLSWTCNPVSQPVLSSTGCTSSYTEEGVARCHPAWTGSFGSMMDIFSMVFLERPFVLLRRTCGSTRDSAKSQPNSKESRVASFFTLKIVPALTRAVPRTHEKAACVHFGNIPPYNLAVFLFSGSKFYKRKSQEG